MKLLFHRLRSAATNRRKEFASIVCVALVGVAFFARTSSSSEEVSGSAKPTVNGSSKPAAKAGSPDVSRVGRKVDEFSLKDFRGAAHRLADWKDSKLIVVAFLGAECPLAKLYAPRLVELEARYRDRGVRFVAINANSQDSPTEIAAYARVHKIEFPVLKDLGQQVADAMGAVRTPEVFVLDESRTIRYHGRIDDQYGIGYIREKATEQDLARALDQLLAGKAVQVAETKAVGCFIGRDRKPSANADSSVTFSNQIARLFQKRCVECHREGEIGPFPLTDYSEVAGWAETILEAVEERRMPPWHASPEHGEFVNARRMNDDEIELIERWVAAGAPEGNRADLPKPLEFTTGWQLDREPDAIISMRETPFDVPAEGGVDYKYFSVDPGFTEDKWIQAAEVQPGNRAVVHHVLVLVRPPQGAPAGAGGGEFLAGYVPGMRARPYPKGMAKLIPKGSKLIFQLHYTPNGSPQQDLSRIGLRFADPKEITHVVVTSRAAETKFAIPPNAENYEVEATSSSHPSELLLLGMMPHMHLRGKSFRYEAVYPDKTREILLDVPRYDFNWQTAYGLVEPKQMPPGTRMHCVAQFDNSENNLSNPDPTQTVRWGDQTWNEMMIGYFDIAVPVGAAAPDRRPGAAIRQALNTPEARRQQGRLLLMRFDANKDGKLQKSEIPERSRPLFDLFDKDKDGNVTLEEIVQGQQGQDS